MTVPEILFRVTDFPRPTNSIGSVVLTIARKRHVDFSLIQFFFPVSLLLSYSLFCLLCMS
ncbi:hypothetical protein GYMLUDRAFT_339716 [Collybiopsis luxurians FD-317 M1]|nr:hypothetical protein GYMLUDRAFT_339716 [Collybiopsis luxurians FD-317 M1]